jgi:hypothetical protein
VLSFALFVERFHIRSVAHDGALIASNLALRAYRDSALWAHLEASHLNDPELDAVVIALCTPLQSFA